MMSSSTGTLLHEMMYLDCIIVDLQVCSKSCYRLMCLCCRLQFTQLHRTCNYIGSAITQDLQLHRICNYTGSAITQDLQLHRSAITQDLQLHKICKAAKLLVMGMDDIISDDGCGIPVSSPAGILYISKYYIISN
jgi:hypothetical protein